VAIQITGLTIPPSIGAVCDRSDPQPAASDAGVQLEFLTYGSPERYDDIVILGRMEHLPDYSTVLW
jgi:hypothetical protein